VVEFTYVTGRRVLDDGTDLDADTKAYRPTIQRRSITSPVSDGSLGDSQYAVGQLNKDGTPI